MKDMTEALNLAIGVENEGYKVYTEAANKTSNKLGKATLLAIAAKEQDHIKAIQKFAKDINQAITLINPRNKKEYIRPIMAEIKGELGVAPQPDKELEKAYRVAMGLEKKSFELYKKLAGQADEPKVKVFFDFLMAEENMHYELLSETLMYLTRTGDWYREQERWLVEG